jgi:hypothetical protein
LITFFVKIVVMKRKIFFDPLQKAALVACGCAALPIVLAQLSGTNHLLRHISPAMIPLGICMGILAKTSKWTESWAGATTAGVLFLVQLGMLTSPVLLPNRQPIALAFPNGAPAWQVMRRFDQWDWSTVRSIGQNCGVDAPKISYLGDGLAFDAPQIEYSWIAEKLPPPDVTWLWRSEEGPLNWQKIMDSAEQSDMVITAPRFVGEPLIKENLDNERNAEFASRLFADQRFRTPIKLAMGRFEPNEVLVFVKTSLACAASSTVAAQH